MAGDSIILEEEIDPDYEPTEAETEEYARWLGMDMETDADLLWIAREGLKVWHTHTKITHCLRHNPPAHSLDLFVFACLCGVWCTRPRYQRTGSRVKPQTRRRSTTSTSRLVLVHGIIPATRSVYTPIRMHTHVSMVLAALTRAPTNHHGRTDSTTATCMRQKRRPSLPNTRSDHLESVTDTVGQC